MALSGSTNIIIITVVFSSLAIIAVLLRFRARVLQRAKILVDDYLIILGLLFAVGIGATNVVNAVLGHLGDHVPLNDNNVPEFDDSLTVYKKTDFATQLLSVLALAFTKLSIVFFYRRIFRGKIFSRITMVLIVMICIWGVSFFFADLLQCIPTKEIWESWENQPGHLEHCYNFIPMFYGTAISNMIMDLIILSVPIPMVWKLQMPTRQKIAVCGIFLLGAFIVGISTARVYFFFSVGANVARAWDITYERAPSIYWSQLEASMSVICACLPTLHVLVAGVSIEGAVKTLAKKVSKMSLLSSSKDSTKNTSVTDVGKNEGISLSSMEARREQSLRSSADV